MKNIRRLVGVLPLMLLVIGCDKVSPNNEISESNASPSSVSSVSHLKEVYELQERCGKHAQEWFKNEYGVAGVVNTEDGQAIPSYVNHYDEASNKCFVMLTYVSLPYKNKKMRPSKSITLFDIHENNEIGSYFRFQGDDSPFQCVIASKICKTEEEWKEKTGRYMGD